MKRNYYWEKIPAKIVTIEKEKQSFGVLRIEAVLESLKSNNEDEGRVFSIVWVYAPSVKTENKVRTNLVPQCFFWAYQNAEKGMNVVVHHCLDDNSHYFYKC